MVKESHNLIGQETRLATLSSQLMLLIKEFCNLVKKGAQPATPKVVISDATFLWWTSPCKIIKIMLLPFPKIPIIKESCNDWATHPTRSSSFRSYLPLLIISMQKSTVLIDFFHRYWWSRNTETWLVQCLNCRIKTDTVMHHFGVKVDTSMD